MRVTFLLVAIIAAKAACNDSEEYLDVALVADSSESVCGQSEGCEAWGDVLTFFMDLSEDWTIGNDQTHVAVATFSDDAKVEWNLDRYKDISSLVAAIDRVKFRGGELKTQGLVKVIVEEIFSQKGGDREGFRNVGILVTDGSPYINPAAAAAASAALQAEGITVFVVCVTTGCDEGFAKSLASPPKELEKTYFLVDDYSSLYKIVNILLEQITIIKKRK